MKPVLYGVCAGLAAILHLLVFYAFDPALMLHWAVMWSSFIWYFIAMYLVAWTADTSDSRLALRNIFTVFIAANAVYYLFYYVMFKYFDPKLVDLQYEMMNRSGWAEGKIKREDVNLTPQAVFFNYVFSLIGGFILSLIVLWVVNRRRQMYHNQ